MPVVDVAQVREHLSIEGTNLDTKLQPYIDGAIAAIGNLCGPLEPTTITRRVRGGGQDDLSLPVTPAISITSLTPIGGTALDTNLMYLDGEAGVVSYLSGQPFRHHYAGFRTYGFDVVYVAGYDPCPADLVMAVLELVRDLWTPAKRGPGRPGTRGTNRTANTVPKTADEMPFEVQKLIAPYIQIAI